VYSETVEDFYYNLDDATRKGPCVYVLDSMDSLTSEQEEEHFGKAKKARRSGKQQPGTYGDGKAKKNSAGIRQALAKLRRSGSILLVVCQTRDNIGASPFQSRKTRSGGRALRFYATCEIWTSVKGAEKRTVRKRARKIGTKVGIRLMKNRVTGKLHDVDTLIYPSYGIDDVGSCINYLLTEGWWTKSKRTINAKRLGKRSRSELIAVCERKPERLLREVQACWTQVQEATSLNRPRRYT